MYKLHRPQHLDYIFASEASPGGWTHPAHTTLLLLMDYNVHSNKTTLPILWLTKRYMRAHDFGLNMTPVNVSLCAETYRLAKNKSNFSDWVRDQLRSERNKHSNNAVRAGRIEQITKISTAELLYQLEQRSEDEINALVSILRGSLSSE